MLKIVFARMGVCSHGVATSAFGLSEAARTRGCIYVWNRATSENQAFYWHSCYCPLGGSQSDVIWNIGTINFSFDVFWAFLCHDFVYFSCLLSKSNLLTRQSLLDFFLASKSIIFCGCKVNKCWKSTQVFSLCLIARYVLSFVSTLIFTPAVLRHFPLCFVGIKSCTQ